MQSEMMKIFNSVALQSLSTADLCVFICVCEHLVICGIFVHLSLLSYSFK